MRRELTESDLLRMKVPKRHWGASFREISDQPREVVEKYLDKFDEFMGKGVGMLFWGDNGLGKTAAAVVVGKEARRRGKTVLFVEAADLKRSVIEKVSFDEETSVWERARSVDVLILDDIGKGVQDSTGFGARMLDELVRHRNARMLATFLTTNMSPRGEQMEAEFKTSTLHTFKECMLPVRFSGRDRRKDAESEIMTMLG
jgi:DNA replication protein DnaC